MSEKKKMYHYTIELSLFEYVDTDNTDDPTKDGESGLYERVYKKLCLEDNPNFEIEDVSVREITDADMNQ